MLPPIFTTMDPLSQVAAASFASLVVVYTVYRRYAGISLADIPGPEPASFLMGMLISFCSTSAHC